MGCFPSFSPHSQLNECLDLSEELFTRQKVRQSEFGPSRSSSPFAPRPQDLFHHG
jgi:hypothetical protein